MDKLKRVLSGNDETTNDENRGIMGDIDEFTTLSWSTRLRGFCVCFVIGIIFSLLGSLMLLLHFGMTRFAIFYTLGNVVSMASTCFLVGPMKQMKNMFSEKRFIASIIVIISFICTLMAAIWFKKGLLALVCIVIQSIAMTWYSLSYIPYARSAVKNALNTCIA
ncbi:vesicle transport protein SFT2B [Sitodiplosis mosellana]|uniref:vesicle transport protein SFT2B n=1 Tax=Sitodiplosis mosellana TaxID=263140 RepID=UPI002443BBCF|nr:vesicle transport protein SFT2B [Sitodiplosis mosellana]